MEDTVLTGTLEATDVESDALSFAAKPGQEPAKGNISISPDGSVSFTPYANANGSDSFGYTISDGTDSTDATAIVFISPTNDNPTLSVTQPGDVGFEENLVLDYTAGDIDGDNLTTLVDVDGGGQVPYAGSISLTPGLHTIDVTVQDGNGGSATQQVTVTKLEDVLAEFASPMGSMSNVDEGTNQTVLYSAADISDPDGHTITDAGIYYDRGDGVKVKVTGNYNDTLGMWMMQIPGQSYEGATPLTDDGIMSVQMYAISNGAESLGPSTSYKVFMNEDTADATFNAIFQELEDAGVILDFSPNNWISNGGDPFGPFDVNALEPPSESHEYITTSDVPDIRQRLDAAEADGIIIRRYEDLTKQELEDAINLNYGFNN
jgi:hypothetical protein